MLGTFICRQCSAQLRRRAVAATIQQRLPRATFFSLRGPAPRERVESLPTETQNEDDQDVPRNESQEGQRAVNRNAETTRTVERLGRYSKLIDRDVHNADGSGANDIRDLDIGSAAPADTTQSIEGPARAIENILGGSEWDRTRKAWVIFEHNFTSRDCDALKAPSIDDAILLREGQVFTNLLRNVVMVFCATQGTPRLTPTTVLFRFQQLGITRPDHWHLSLFLMTRKLVVSVNSPAESGRDLPSILYELLSVWRLFFQCLGPGAVDSPELISNQWNIPTKGELPKVHDAKDFPYRLQQYHPKLVGHPILGFCAIYLYSISEALSSIEELRKDSEPILQFFEHLLAGSRVTSVLAYVEASKSLQRLPDEPREQISIEIDAAPRKAMVALGLQGESLGHERSEDRFANLEVFYLKRISRAVETRTSATALNKLWDEAQAAYKPKNGKSTMPPKVYDSFISGFLTLLHAPHAQNVWNHMIANGVKPTLQSWNALLEGCIQMKDRNGFNEVWKRMRDAGAEPDNYLWTSRIKGLFAFGEVKNGLAAMDEMGYRWKTAQDAIDTTKPRGAGRRKPAGSTVNIHAKPSVQVINAAISSLAQLPSKSMRQQEKIAHTQKILSWSSAFAIQPDARTHNLLMQLYLQAGDMQTAFKVLHQMEKNGVDVDLATHTMLMTASFRGGSFDNLSKEEQAQSVLTRFDEIESSGLTLNNYIYSTAIDRLLKQHSNHDAVRLIIDHMTKRGLTPSAQAYTSLITYYFQMGAAAMPAVDSLVQQIFTTNRIPNDRYMFDRLIEGYGAQKEVTKMMGVVDQMSSHGKVPSWYALTAVIQCLSDAGDLQRASSIVRDVARNQGIAENGVTGGAEGQKTFFAKARTYNIADHQREQGDDRVDVMPTAEVNRGNTIARKESESIKTEGDIHGFLADEASVATSERPMQQPPKSRLFQTLWKSS